VNSDPSPEERHVTAQLSAPIDARHVGSAHLPYGATLNARIAIAIITDLADRGALTNDAIDCLAGLPDVYDVRTRTQLYT
jgi:hypothetical protein